MSDLELLLTLQERDLALDRLRHRRVTLPERAQRAQAGARQAELQAQASELRAARDELARDEQRLADEVQGVRSHAEATDAKLYSGEVTSPRELQAMQADVEQLRRHQRVVEDRQLDVMERREPLDVELAALDEHLAAVSAEVAELDARLASLEGEIDAEIAGERAARADVLAGIDEGSAAEYERVRAKSNGVGAARLVGYTCQGCHLTIPSTEVERIRKAPPGTVAHCDNCGCILVP